MNWTLFYFDMISNVLSFFTMELFITYFSESMKDNTRQRLRVIFFFVYCIYAIVPAHADPAFEEGTTFIFTWLSHFIFIFFSTDISFKAKIILQLKFEAFTVLTGFFTVIADNVLTRDLNQLTEQGLYFDYKTLIYIALQYVILSLFIHSRRISTVSVKSRYRSLFNLVIAICIIALTFTAMILGSNIINERDALPIVFSLLLIIVFVCLSAYDGIVTTLEKETLQELELEKLRLGGAYYQKINESLVTLSHMKHDFKNHLILINGYAKQNNTALIQDYISKVVEQITAQDNQIHSNNPTISSILSAKYQDCIKQKVGFKYHLDFVEIYVDEFVMMTILGNVLDNAITAASKMKDGKISLHIKQIDSHLQICCINNHCEQIVKKKNRLMTTKKDNPQFHGIGLNNVNQAVTTSNGIIEIQYTEYEFTMNISLPNYK